MEQDQDKPLVQMVNLLIGVEKGDFALAARAQEKLRELGWYVSKTPLEEPKPATRKKSTPTSPQ
jgi:hypothetical protein